MVTKEAFLKRIAELKQERKEKQSRTKTEVKGYFYERYKRSKKKWAKRFYK